MKVALHLVNARRDRLASLLQKHRYLPIRELCGRFQISEATARRDLVFLGREKRITRTYGGALGDFNQHFFSFDERQRREPEAKNKMAQLALGEFRPHTVCYLDAGTTMLAIAEALKRHPVGPLTLVTNNLPVAKVLTEVKGVQVFLLGGQVLSRQLAMFGDKSRQDLKSWSFDLAFLGAEGMTEKGIWNSQEEVVLLQQMVARRTSRTVFCLDSTKIHSRAPHFLMPWSKVNCLLTNASGEKLRKEKICLKENQILSTQTQN